MPPHLREAQKRPILNRVKLLSLGKIGYFISLVGLPYVSVNVTHNLLMFLLVNKWKYSSFYWLNFDLLEMTLVLPHVFYKHILLISLGGSIWRYPHFWWTSARSPLSYLHEIQMNLFFLNINQFLGIFFPYRMPTSSLLTMFS